MPDNKLQLEAFLPYRLNRAAETISQEFSKLYRDRFGLTRPEWRCLATVGQFSRVTATAVADHSAMHKTKVSRAVAALERRRWLRRIADDIDRRVDHLELTAAGTAAYREMAEIALAYQKRLLESLGEEGLGLLQGLSAIEREQRK